MTLRRSIPSVGSDLTSHTRTLEAIKEAIETGQGLRADFGDAFITFTVADGLGLLTAKFGAAVNKVQSFIGLPMSSPWVSYDSSNMAVPFHSIPGYYKDALSRVFLRGLVVGGASGSIVAVLPEGFRPEYTTVFVCLGILSGTELGVRVDVTPAGQVRYQGTGTPAYLSLDGISFAAYQ